MTKHLALSVLGKDRPGIVAAISKALYETGCNIEDSSMTIIESEFAMILIVALGTKSSAASIKKKLGSAAKKLGMTISIRDLKKTESKKERISRNTYIISVYGSDKPGIVYKISNLLALNKVNITDVQTSRTGADKKATYIMILETDFPSTQKADEVKSKLQEMARTLDVKIGINPVEAPQM